MDDAISDSLAVQAAGAGKEPLRFYTRDQDDGETIRLFSERDLIELGLQGLYAGTAAFAPRDRWAGVARRLALLRIAKHRRKHYHVFADAVEAALGEQGPDKTYAMFQRWRCRLHERRLSVMADLVSRTRPEFDIAGGGALDRSVAAGKGVILWSLQFAFHSLAGKRGLSEAGYRINQVSSDLHGPTHTTFGRAVTNKSAIMAENRYLAERLVFGADEGPAVLRRALRVLNKGGIVNFTNTTYSGRSFVEMPFGKAAYVHMPVTPVALAAAHGIPLHVVFTAAKAPFAAYHIAVSDDLTAGLGGAGRRDIAALEPVFLAARDRLLDAVQQYPDQYLPWGNIKTARSGPVIDAA